MGQHEKGVQLRWAEMGKLRLTRCCFAPFFSTHPCTSSDDPLPLPLKKRPCLLASSTLPSQRTMIALLLKLHSLV